MSDFNGQKCDVCGAVNTANATSWVRIFGITMGPARQPMMNLTPTIGVHRILPPKLDFCPACAAKTTVDKLPTLAAKPFPSK